MRGHVRQRGSTWSIVYDERPDPVTGDRQQRERGGFASRDEAETALAEAIAAVKRGGYVRPDEVTVGQFLHDWIGRKAQDDLKASTAASYRSKITRHLVPRLGALRVQELTVSVVEDALRNVHREGGPGGRPLSRRTVDYCRVVLAAALDDAVRRQLLAANPARIARIPRREHDDWSPRSNPQPPWSVAELRQWLASVAEDRLVALWHLYAMAGLRRGEALALRWSDVDLDTGTVAVRRNRVTVNGPPRRVIDEDTPKTDSSRREVSLDEATTAMLRRHRVEQNAERLAAGTAWVDEDRVFTREDGEGLDPDQVSTRFRESAAEARLRRIRLHDVRHSHATLMLEAGVPVEVLSERLGHSRNSTTMDLYVHPSQEQQRKAADAFGALLAGGDSA